MPLLSKDASGNMLEGVGSQTVAVETVAAAGTVIANATAISANCGLALVTGADDTKGVVLPATVPGKIVRVYNNAATAGLKLYPAINSTLNDGTANAALVLEGRFLATFVATSSTNWAAAFTVNA